MKKTLALLIACIFLAVIAHAEEPKKEALSIWEKIRNKIEKITPKQKPTVTTAVGGVRGAQSDNHELYWKGEEEPIQVSSEEIKLFSSALGLAEAGESSAASKAFQSFIDQYPQSPLAADAESALTELAATTQPAVPADPHDYPPPELPSFKVDM